MRRILSSINPNRVVGRTWSDFIRNLEDKTGIAIDSIYRNRYEQFIEGYKDGKIYEMEVTKYFDTGHETSYETCYDDICYVEPYQSRYDY